jgi:protein gp37
MAARAAIEWTHVSWNPVTGCSKVSPGCAHCYAERMARRLQAMGQPRYARGFEVVAHDESLELPLRWKKPREVFVTSMGDLFHDDVPEGFIVRVFDVMRRAQQHRFQLLTKRSRRLAEMSSQLPWPPNVWAGVTAERADCQWRIADLRQTPAAIKFLSLEPLLGPIEPLDLEGIDWVIVGGESGARARPMDGDWVRSIRNQCVSSGVAFFFKQWGGVHRRSGGRELDGRLWSEKPAAIDVPSPALASNGEAQLRFEDYDGFAGRHDLEAVG